MLLMVLNHVQSFVMIFVLPSLWSYIHPYLLDKAIKDDHMLISTWDYNSSPGLLIFMYRIILLSHDIWGLLIFFLRHGLTMLSSLAWNSLSRGGWTQTPSVSAFLVLGSKACATVVFPKPIWMGEVNGKNKEEWLDFVMHTFMSWTDVSSNPTLVKNS